MKRFLYCSSAATDEQLIPADNVVGFDVKMLQTFGFTMQELMALIMVAS